MKYLLSILLALLPLLVSAQDTIREEAGPEPDSLWQTARPQKDTVYVFNTDTVTLRHTDTVTLIHTDTVRIRVVDTFALQAMKEKEIFYREILTSNGVDKEKLERERNYYIHVVDSLRSIVRLAEIEAARKDEANKYLTERAKVAEEKVATATNRKKKVRPVQGIAMRFYRTPAWEIRLNANSKRYIANRNAGSIEFDYVTGASVMLWDLTRYFNKNHSVSTNEIRRFDQDFAYDLGIYIGFGGSNLFKNFYVGASFRFVDFFYFTAGFNVAEYQVLAEGYKSGEVLTAGQSIDDITAKSWLLKPFISLSIDLDFLSYIKK